MVCGCDGWVGGGIQGTPKNCWGLVTGPGPRDWGQLSYSPECSRDLSRLQESLEALKWAFVPGLDQERAQSRPLGRSRDTAKTWEGDQGRGLLQARKGEGQGALQGQGPPWGQDCRNPWLMDMDGDMVRAGPGLSGLSFLQKPDCAR